MFRIFDINNCGTISKKEVTRIVQVLYDYQVSEKEELATKIFDEMDTNEDGRVTQGEFVKAMLNGKHLTEMLVYKVLGTEDWFFYPTS